MNDTERLKTGLTLEQQQEITKRLEGYRANPSNSNKWRYDLFAYLDEQIVALLDEARNEAKITVLKQLERKQPPATWSEDYSPLYNQGFNTMRSKVGFERQRLEKLTQKQEN